MAAFLLGGKILVYGGSKIDVTDQIDPVSNLDWFDHV